MIIPDAVEPFIGWKFLNVDPAGLQSPLKGDLWPQKRRLEARCATVGHTYVTKVFPPGQEIDPGPLFVAILQPNEVVNFWLLSDITVTYHSGPETEPGSQLAVYPTKEQEPPVKEECGCGIYVVSSPLDCRQYWRPGRVLAQVALWGKVIRGNRGARGQYAYPQRVIGLGNIAGSLSRLSVQYGIPFEIAWTDSYSRLLLEVATRENKR